jgi:uncharacterized membrane protein YeaQ/YmgE (transglycosylase-associated protein family)
VSIVGWPVLGPVAALIASRLVNKTGEGVLPSIVLDIVGAVVGGFLCTRLGATEVTGFDLYGMFVAAVGAVLVLVVYHAPLGRRAV